MELEVLKVRYTYHDAHGYKQMKRYWMFLLNRGIQRMLTNLVLFVLLLKCGLPFSPILCLFCYFPG